MSKKLHDQTSIDDLFRRCIDGLESTRVQWLLAKPGVKRTWLGVTKNYLERLIRLAEMEEAADE